MHCQKKHSAVFKSSPEPTSSPMPRQRSSNCCLSGCLIILIVTALLAGLLLYSGSVSIQLYHDTPPGETESPPKPLTI
jgi:hypothetical protein